MKHGEESVVIQQACALAIKALRKKSGYAQEALALEAGIDRAYMSRLERGVHAPNVDTIFKLLPLLGVSFAEFAAEVEACIRRLKRKGG